MMWLVNIALRRPLSVAVMSLLMLVFGVMSFAYMNTDIFPAGSNDGLELSGTLSIPHGAAHGDHQRARPLDHAQRNRTHGIGVHPGHRHRKDLFSAQCGSGLLDGAGKCGRRADPSSVAARNPAAADHLLQRFERPGSSTQCV